MQYLIGAVAFVIILSLIVVIHEMGHFIMAKRAKVLCYEFSLGMGPLIWKKKKGETVYAIRCIPIGGYVSMAGEEVEQDFLKDVKEVKVEFDENNRIKRIICDVNNEKFKDLQTYKLVLYDLYGTAEALDDELYLVLQKEDEEEVKYIVNRDASVYFNKKQELQISPYDRSFANKKLLPRFLTVFAGPFMNFVLAILIYLVLGICQGYPNTDGTTLEAIDKSAPIYTQIDGTEGFRGGETIVSINGQEVSVWEDITKVLSEYARGEKLGYNRLVVGYTDGTDEVKYKTFNPSISVTAIELVFSQNGIKSGIAEIGSYQSEDTNKKTKAYKAGLRAGDVITELQAGEYSKSVLSIKDVLEFFNNEKLAEGQDVKVTVLRDIDETEGINLEPKTFTVESYSHKLLESQNVRISQVQLGISPDYQFDFVKLLYMPFVETGSSIVGIFKTLGLLFTDSSVHLDDFSGPVGIFQLVTSTASQGFFAILSLIAFLSCNIGFVNLIPLPALDGGRLAFMGYELIARRKPSPKVENIIHTIGFVLLMALFVFISFSDVLRCIGCK